jgi:hypothetical protein
VGLVQLRRLRRPAVTAVAGDASTGNGRDDLGLHVDVPHHVTVSLRHVHVAFAIESNFVRRAEQRCPGRAAVTCMSLRSRAGDNGHTFRAEIKAQDSIAAEVCPVKSAIRTKHNTIGIVDRGCVRRRSIGGRSGYTGSDECRDAPPGLRI